MTLSDDSRKTTLALSLPSVVQSALQAVELSPLGLMLSNERDIAWCNDRFASLFGFAPAELTGQNLAMLYPSIGEYQRIGDRGHKVMRDCGEYQDERLMRRRNGQLQWFRVHGRALDMNDPFLVASWTFEPLAAGMDASRLTPREREVLATMARGQTAKETGKALGISPRTVEKLQAGLRSKLGAHNAAELMRRISGLPL